MSSVRAHSDRVCGLDLVRLDQLVAVALWVEIELQVWLGHSIPDRLYASLAAALLTCGVAVRRHWPLSAVSVVLVLMTVRIVFGEGGNLSTAAGVMVGVILLLYGLGAFASERRSVWMLAAAVLITSLNQLTKPGGRVAGLFPMEAFAVLLPYALGRVMRARAARELASRDTAERLDAALLTSARAAAHDERSRIARELHDVIAHSVSVMVIQAGGARLVMGDAPERAEESLRSVERAGGEALVELRRLLGILGDGDPHALAPQPGLRDIAPLLAHAQESGISADLRVDGNPVPVPPALDLCAYRIVQEALTNAIKHAAPAHASVNVRWGESVLELEISDDGRRRRSVKRTAGGHGIAGMRERVALHRVDGSDGEVVDAWETLPTAWGSRAGFGVLPDRDPMREGRSRVGERRSGWSGRTWRRASG
jgi:signal transduction histidine kinase